MTKKIVHIITLLCMVMVSSAHAVCNEDVSNNVHFLDKGTADLKKDNFLVEAEKQDSQQLPSDISHKCHCFNGTYFKVYSSVPFVFDFSEVLFFARHTNEVTAFFPDPLLQPPSHI